MAEGTIGSVAVEVVPDAQRFWRRFREQTRAGAAESGRRAGEDWQRGFNAAVRDTEVRVRANTTEARKETHLLRDSLIALAPAVIPLAGAAATGGAALVSMGATGAIAIKGIRDDIKAANADGLQFSAGLNILKGDLGQLAQTSAHSILGEFSEASAKLHAQLPAVNADLADSSKVLGDIVGHLLGGIIGGEHTFAPALLEIERGVDRLAARFESWATGPGGEKFAQALIDDFQHVEPLLENVATLIAHVVAAGNGPGLVIVDELTGLTHILDEIPIPVLSALTTGLVALKAASLVSGLMDKLALSIRGVAAAEGEAAAAASFRGGLAKTVGFLGKVGAGYVAARVAIDAFAAHTDSARTSTDAMTRYTAQFVHVADELVHLDLKGAVGYLFGGASRDDQVARDNADLIDHYRKLTGQLRFFGPAAANAQSRSEALNHEQIDLVASLQAGHQVLTQTTLGEEIAAEKTQELTRNTAALANVFDQLHGKVGGGAQITQLASAYTQAEQAVQGNIKNGEKFLKLGGDTIDVYHGVTVTLGMYKAALAKTGSDAGAIGYIQAQIDALTKNRAALAQMAAEQANVATFVSDVGTKYKLTSDQIDVYTAALGLNIDEIAKGGSALKAAEADLATFVGILRNGNVALDGWLAAVAQFAKSADTAADRASLIGAALRAANGDMLGYANTMVQAATANQQLVTDFKNLKDGVLDLKHGTIDYHNAAAGPLLADLQNLQTAAVNNAAAIYQHFNALGDAGAADKAFRAYVNDTQGALIGQASQLGLTEKQAKKLSDRYFGIKDSGDLRKQIELLGADKVQQALQGILDDLDIMAGKKTVLSVEIDTHNRAVKPGGLGGPVRTRASGGGVPDGLFTVGERGWELGIKRGSHVEIIDNATAKAMTGWNRVPGFASGTGGPTNPFTGVDYSGNTTRNARTKTLKEYATTYTVAGQDYSSLQAAQNAAKRLFKAQVALGVKIDDKDLTSFRHALSGTVDQARAAFRTMFDDAKKLGISRKLAATLRDENGVLDRYVDDRNRTADKLKAVTEKFNEVRDSVSSAGRGAFDLASAGTGFDGQQPVTFDNIEAQQTQAANLVKAWAAGIRKLAGTFGKSATGKAMLRRLAEDGPSDYPEVKALLTAAPKDLASLISTQSIIDKTAGDLGNFIGNKLYGGQISQLKAELRIDDRSIDRLASRMEHQFEHAVDALADRPVKLYADGREIARVVTEGARKNKRRGG